MPATRRLTLLPEKMELSMALLEMCHAIRSGGKVLAGNLGQKATDFLNRLEEEEIDWVLVGASAMNLYLARPRATQDVDVVVRRPHLRKVKVILAELCLEWSQSPVHLHGVLSWEPMKLDVDIIKSTAHVLMDVSLDRKVIVDGVKTVPLEGVLALKYLSAVSPWRERGKRFQDVTDFIITFRDNAPRIDRPLLIELASLAHEKAPADFPPFLDAVENDRPITL